jgi:hypothetical protein
MNGAGETLDEGYNRKCISCQQPTPTGPICERCQRGGRRPRSKSFSQAELTQFAIERQQAPPPLSPRGVVSNPMMMMRGGMNNLPTPMSARAPPPVMRAAYPQPTSSLATASSPSNNNNTPVVASSMLPMSAMPAYRPSAPTGPPLYHQPSARSPPLPGMSMRSYPQPIQQQQQQQQAPPPVQVQRPVLGGSGASQAALRYEPITASNEAESSRNMTMSDFDDDNDRDALANDASSHHAALSSSAPTASRRRSASLTSIETDGRLDAARQVGVDGSCTGFFIFAFFFFP